MASNVILYGESEYFANLVAQDAAKFLIFQK